MDHDQPIAHRPRASGNMSQFGISYDLLVWKSNIVREGFWYSAFQLLKETDQFSLETAGKLEGCWVLKQDFAEDL
ncbi:hypothetical protein [Metabacillus sp. RGM 3146]|uniref:hypothetical protein n=1 Tax=Metabacillus sp. RGM 3146 TaxID=3401092 RepID=UPI003B9D3220